MRIFMALLRDKIRQDNDLQDNDLQDKDLIEGLSGSPLQCLDIPMFYEQ